MDLMRSKAHAIFHFFDAKKVLQMATVNMENIYRNIGA